MIEKVKILGIDPGTAIVGYGIIEFDGYDYFPQSYNVIKTSSKLSLSKRLAIIYDNLCEIIKLNKPDEIAIEKIFFTKNVKTAIDVGQARGVILLACEKNDIRIFEYTPLEVKQGITGYGNADKSQIQELLKLMLNLEEVPKPDDAADALAIAICHANRRKIDMLSTIG